MLLTKFKFVNHEGLTGLMYKGRLIPFEKITDQMAEELLKKTHVLERLPADVAEPAPTELPAAVAEAAEPAALPEASASDKKKDA